MSKLCLCVTSNDLIGQSRWQPFCFLFIICHSFNSRNKHCIMETESKVEVQNPRRIIYIYSKALLLRPLKHDNKDLSASKITCFWYQRADFNEIWSCCKYSSTPTFCITQLFLKFIKFHLKTTLYNWSAIKSPPIFSSKPLSSLYFRIYN